VQQLISKVKTVDKEVKVNKVVLGEMEKKVILHPK
jgi:hypothetical protein